MDFISLVIAFGPILSIATQAVIIICLIMCTIYLGKIYRILKRKFD
ncbi:hypothetical protein [Clostridium mediterraneense]|nr:hypothetical protein [Clostridium mediterraneense]